MRNTLMMEEWVLFYIVAVMGFLPMIVLLLLVLLYGAAEKIDSFRHRKAAETRRKVKEERGAKDAAIT